MMWSAKNVIPSSGQFASYLRTKVRQSQREDTRIATLAVSEHVCEHRTSRWSTQSPSQDRWAAYKAAHCLR